MWSAITALLLGALTGAAAAAAIAWMVKGLHEESASSRPRDAKGRPTDRGPSRSEPPDRR